jgi:hypothetical protein
MSSPGQSTSSFHSRRKTRFEEAIRDSLRRGIRVYGSASPKLIEKIQAEVDAEKLEKEKK